MKKTDWVYLEDILVAINKIEFFVDEMKFEDFLEDNRTQFAVFYALEVVGEAANKLSQKFVVRHSELPMREAVEMRNILIHGYDQIKMDVVWKTIKDHLPQFKEQLEEILI